MKNASARGAWWSTPFSVFPVLLILACLPGTELRGQSFWNTTSGLWSDAASWQPAQAPASSPSTSLIFGGSTDYTATQDLGSFSLGLLRFTNTAGTAVIDALPTSNSLVLAGSATGQAPRLELTDAGHATISAAIAWSSSAQVVGSGSGTLLLNGSQTFALGTKHTISNLGSGVITLADASTYSTSAGGTGLVLRLVNQNSATGSFNVGNLGGLGNVTVEVGGTGTVRFSGSVSGDLFSDSAVLRVLAGASFDFAGNGETMGAVTGAGNILLTGASLTTTAAGHYQISGTLSGSGGVAVGGSTHTLYLTGSSTYAGATSVNAGRLIVGAAAPSGSAGALGSATSEVNLGNTTGTSNATLLIGGDGLAVGRTIRVRSGNTGVATLGSLNTSGTATFSGNVFLGSNSGAARGLTVSTLAGGTLEFTGNLLRATTGATGSTDTLTLTGGGKVILSGANTFTGVTTLGGGTLVLDHTTNNGGKLSSTAGLVMTGGSLTLNGSGGAASTQTVAGLTLGGSTGPLGGGGRVVVTSGLDRDATLNLGAITRNTGTSVDFATYATGTGSAAITTTSSNTAAGILGGHATFDRGGWAMNDGGGRIIPLAAGGYASTLGSGLHTSLAAGVALPSGGATTGTLRFTSAAALTFAATSNPLTLQSAAILVTPGTGAVTLGTTSVRGTLVPTGRELFIHQHSTDGVLTIHSTLLTANVDHLAKSGEGTVVLTGSNTFTGGISINAGTLSATASANLGSSATKIYLNGGTLAVPSGTIGTSSTFSASGRNLVIGPAGGALQLGAGVVQEFQGGGIIGAGRLTLTGPGTMGVGSNTSTYSGEIVIQNGTLRQYSNQLTSVMGVQVMPGASFEINDDATGSFSIATGARLVLNGDGYNGGGAFRLTDQSPTNPRADPATTFTRDIELQTDSRVLVDVAAAQGSTAQLTFTGNVSGGGGLVKSGAGMLTLTARDNTYAGMTRVENGILRLNLGSDRLPTGTTVVLGAGVASGILRLNGYSQTLAGLESNGTGLANSVQGGSEAALSVLTLRQGGSFTTYDGRLGGTGTDNTHAGNNLAFVKEGAGSLTLGQANTHSGTTRVNEGTLVLGNARALGFGGVSLAAENAGTLVAAGATLDLNGQDGVREVITLNGTGLGGQGALVNHGGTPAVLAGGVASLSIASATTAGWSGAATITLDAPASGTAAAAQAVFGLSQGSLSITSGGSGLGLVPVVTVSGGGGDGAVVTTGVGLTNASFTITSGTTTYSTAPTVTLSNGATGEAVLNGAGLVIGINITSPGNGFTAAPTATFSGGGILSAGTSPAATGNATNFTLTSLNIVNPGTGYTSAPTVAVSGGSGTVVTANDSSFTLQGFQLTDGGTGHTSAPGVVISGGSASATANVAAVILASDSSVGGSGDLFIHSQVRGPGALIKTGAGTLVLAAANAYTGETIVSGGNLQVGLSGGGTSGLGNVSLNGSGTVLSGTGTILGGTTVFLGTLKPGDAGGSETGTLTTQSLALLPASTMTVAEFQITGSANAGGTAHDRLDIQGGFSLNSSSRIVVDGTGYTPSVGDVFNLIQWAGLLDTGGFTTGVNLRTGADAALDEGMLDLPDITGFGFWDIAFGGGALTLTVVVPEPGRLLLLMAGLLLLFQKRRR